MPEVFNPRRQTPQGQPTAKHNINLSHGWLGTLQWRHIDHDSVSNHQPHGCLLNRLFRRRSKKTSKLRVTGLCVGNSSGPVNSPHKGPVTRKMFPFDDVIMRQCSSGPVGGTGGKTALQSQDPSEDRNVTWKWVIVEKVAYRNNINVSVAERR